MEILTFILWVMCIWGCHHMAKEQGRNEILAVFLGAFFGVFAVIGYWVIGKKNV